MGSSRWMPDPENAVNGEAIQSAIFSLLSSTCDTVYCVGERARFSSSFRVVFSQFLPPNAPITPYNIRYLWFFLSYGSL